MKPRVKICGVTRPEDAEIAVRFGATDIGCVLVADSGRRVDPELAREIFAAAGEGTGHVLVFRQAPANVVQEMAEAVGVRDVQLFHYAESEAVQLESLGFRVYRVHEVPTGCNALPPLRPEPSPERPAVLDVAPGVSNITFPWEILGPEAPPGTFISGNVRPENVCALLTHHPYGIDLCSGVEMDVGRKDPDRLELLFDTLGAALG
jgi:phosphoribosylanthranilate isomerase